MADRPLATLCTPAAIGTVRVLQLPLFPALPGAPERDRTAIGHGQPCGTRLVGRGLHRGDVLIGAVVAVLECPRGYDRPPPRLLDHAGVV